MDGKVKMNIKMKLDVTLLQSNTVIELVKFITDQHVVIKKFENDEHVTAKEISDIKENYDTVGILHQRALHKRLGRISTKEIDRLTSE